MASRFICMLLCLPVELLATRFHSYVPIGLTGSSRFDEEPVFNFEPILLPLLRKLSIDFLFSE